MVGLGTSQDKELEQNIEELKSLANALEIEVAGTALQYMPHPNPATYIGAGKAEEIANLCDMTEATYCIFEDTLTPAQHRNLQKIIHAEILDRTGLILNIFSKRAQTREARLQVETAQLQYMLPRLIGMWEAIGRQGGASGSKSNKGVGETQLELDRRWIQKRLTELRRELETIEHDRSVQRSKREKSGLPLVALVGYTNAGKSTIMNRFIDTIDVSEEKKVLEKDMLFATLDTSIRRIVSDEKKDFLLSDTVGFINNLPHSLVKAFRSTLEEIKYADLLVQVVDYSDERYLEQMKVTENTLKEIGVTDIPMIYVMNKVDKCKDVENYPKVIDDKIYLCAVNSSCIEALKRFITDRVYNKNSIEEFIIPYEKGSLINEINRNANILEQEYREDGVYIKADVTEALLGRVNKELNIYPKYDEDM